MKRIAGFEPASATILVTDKDGIVNAEPDVRVYCTLDFSLSSCDTRTFAALLVRAADEADVMRRVQEAEVEKRRI